ncbi:hypothetical protein LINPERHAP2_LOCUS44617 [Linum perenne]
MAVLNDLNPSGLVCTTPIVFNDKYKVVLYKEPSLFGAGNASMNETFDRKKEKKSSS